MDLFRNDRCLIRNLEMVVLVNSEQGLDGTAKSRKLVGSSKTSVINFDFEVPIYFLGVNIKNRQHVV